MKRQRHRADQILIKLREAEAASIGTLYIEPGAPWENGYAESFNSLLRDELLNAEEFVDVRDAKAHGSRWKDEYNHHRPHSSLGYVPPARFAAMCEVKGEAGCSRVNGFPSSDSHNLWYMKQGQVTVRPGCENHCLHEPRQQERQFQRDVPVIDLTERDDAGRERENQRDVHNSRAQAHHEPCGLACV